jgi:hypothetical protein
MWLSACGLACGATQFQRKRRCTKGVRQKARKETSARQELAGGEAWLRWWWRRIHLESEYLGAKAGPKLHGKHGCSDYRHEEHGHTGHRCSGSLADQELCEAGKAIRQRHEVEWRCDAVLSRSAAQSGTAWRRSATPAQNLGAMAGQIRRTACRGALDFLGAKADAQSRGSQHKRPGTMTQGRRTGCCALSVQSVEHMAGIH